MANRQQTYDAIEKMLATLNDPFTRFLDPSRYSALKGGTRGSPCLAMTACMDKVKSGGVVNGVGVELAFSSGMKAAQPELTVCAAKRE